MFSRLRQRFIYILGPEGAGKTTVARLLSCHIRTEWSGRVKVTEIRSSHLYVYYFKNFLMRLGRFEYYKYPREILIKRIDRLYLNRIIKFLIFAEFTAVILLILFVRLRSLLGYVVICTRYVIDTIVDLLAYTLVAPQGRLLVYKLITPVLLRLIPKGSPIIYLNADYSTLVRRYEKRGSPIEPPNWIGFYGKVSHTLLRAISDHHKIISIDTGSKSYLQVFREVLQAIFSKRLAVNDGEGKQS